MHCLEKKRKKEKFMLLLLVLLFVAVVLLVLLPGCLFGSTCLMTASCSVARKYGGLTFPPVTFHSIASCSRSRLEQSM